MKGASNPGKEWVGEVSLKHVYEIALIKQTVSCSSHPSSGGGGGKGAYIEGIFLGSAIIRIKLEGTCWLCDCSGEDNWDKG